MPFPREFPFRRKSLKRWYLSNHTLRVIADLLAVRGPATSRDSPATWSAIQSSKEPDTSSNMPRDALKNTGMCSLDTFDQGTVMVPVPGHAPRRHQYLWPAKAIAEAMIKRQLSDRIVPMLHRPSRHWELDETGQPTTRSSMSVAGSRSSRPFPPRGRGAASANSCSTSRRRSLRPTGSNTTRRPTGAATPRPASGRSSARSRRWRPRSGSPRSRPDRPP